MKPSHSDIQLSLQSFSILPLQAPLLSNLRSLGYETMTPIQEQTLPIMLQGRDVIATSKTGSGKTAAFGLSLLHHLEIECLEVQALVLCPTRELAEQVTQTLRRLARLILNLKILNLSGGMPIRQQSDSLKYGAHIIVGTPGRVQKLLDQSALSVKKLKTLVLDEADRMLDMGFFEEIKKIIQVCPLKRQTLMFSATYPAEIRKLSKVFMKNPQEVLIETVHSPQAISQFFYEVKNSADKFSLLKSILLHYQTSSTLIFCNTKQQTAQLFQLLTKAGFSVVALHGDLSQAERDLAIIRFTNQSCSIMVATDVAARGLDIKELPLVINFELAFDQEVHTHRIGRTGRAGCEGLAVSLTTPSDALRLNIIENQLNHPLSWGNISLLKPKSAKILSPEMVTLQLQAGRKDKLRPGDIQGAFIKDAGLPINSIGKIIITDNNAFVAIHKNQVNKILDYFQTGKLKGRRIKANLIRNST